jgi:hypothetical protein
MNGSNTTTTAVAEFIKTTDHLISTVSQGNDIFDFFPVMPETI